MCGNFCLELLGVEEGQEHQLFVVLKSIPYLAKNVVQNVAVELVVVCANISSCPSVRSECLRCAQ